MQPSILNQSVCRHDIRAVRCHPGGVGADDAADLSRATKAGSAWGRLVGGSRGRAGRSPPSRSQGPTGQQASPAWPGGRSLASSRSSPSPFAPFTSTRHIEPLMPLRAGGLEHEGHESTRNTRKEVLLASRFSCLSRPFAAFVIQTPLEPLMPLRRSPLSMVSVLFSAVSDSSAYKTPASGHGLDGN